MAAREYESWRLARQGSVRRRLSTPELVETCQMDEEAQTFLEDMAKAYAMSGRSIMRLLSVARTIADMEQSSRVAQDHLAEALGFRLREGVGSS